MQTRIVVLGDAWGLLRFLDDDAYELDPKAAAKELGPDAVPVLDAAVAALETVSDWTTPDIEAALKSSLIDGLELKPRKAFGPIRVAVTGSSVSPPLFESLELLGRERSLARLREAPRQAEGRVPGRVKERHRNSLVVCSSAHTEQSARGTRDGRHKRRKGF